MKRTTLHKYPACHYIGNSVSGSIRQLEIHYLGAIQKASEFMHPGQAPSATEPHTEYLKVVRGTDLPATDLKKSPENSISNYLLPL